MSRDTGCFDRKDVVVWDLFPRGQIAHVADITPNERNHGATDQPAGRLVAFQEGEEEPKEAGNGFRSHRSARGTLHVRGLVKTSHQTRSNPYR